MKKQIDRKLLVIIVLLIGVGMLSVGLAAFSSNLNIKSSTTVSPSSENFKLELSCSKDGADECELAPTSNNSELVEKSSKAIIENNGDSLVIRNLNFYFTEPGQDLAYTFYVRNIGNLDAYVEHFGQRNIEGYNRAIRCTAGEGTSQALVNQLCDASSESFKLYYKAIHYGRHGNAIDTAFSASRSFDRPLEKEGNEVRLNIVYDTNAPRVDGPVSIELGEFYINFTSTPYIK